MIRIFCDICQLNLEVDDSMAGQIIQCPQCKNDYFVEGAPMSDRVQQKACPYCGETVLATAKKCKHCGEFFAMRQTNMMQYLRESKSSEKNIAPLLFFYIILGGIGMHYFYAGQPVPGIFLFCLFLLNVLLYIMFPMLMLPFLLIIAIWLLVDFFRIVTGNFTDADDNKITQW